MFFALSAWGGSCSRHAERVPSALMREEGACGRLRLAGGESGRSGVLRRAQTVAQRATVAPKKAVMTSAMGATAMKTVSTRAMKG